MEKIKTFFIRTYGCQMNELDSEVMCGILERKGLKAAPSEEEADLIIYNTCSVRDLAERKALGKLGHLVKRTRKRNSLIGIAGCMATSKKEALFKKIPHLDFVLGTNDIHELENVLSRLVEGEKQIIEARPQFEHELDYTSAHRKSDIFANISIIRGCNKFCTYCIVPYSRGREVSRPYASIIEEAKELADRGVKEICLLGQNVDSYGKDRPNSPLFHDLLSGLNELSGLVRIRFLTSHPQDISLELMQAIRDLDKVCEYVHFPLQAGSNTVLKRMNRSYTKEEYLEKVARLREFVPSIAIGTDIIVGFPGETAEDFQETLDTFEKIQFSQAFLFAFSKRKGTAAYRFVDDVSEDEKNRRLQKIIELHEKIISQQLTSFLSKEVEVLVEEESGRDPDFLKGKTRCSRSTVFKGRKSLIGTLQKVKIHSFSNQTLLGALEDRVNFS
jgi:tRNA-2-methylthio-N6-dimethylallyladenosine synthase